MNDFERARKIMMENHLKARGISDKAVLRAMEEVPRHAFLPDDMAEFVYEDSPLPIGEGQTISQPYIVAAMTEMLELKKDDKVLDVGTGSGYAAAILSRIVEEVYSIERHRVLAESAKEVLRLLGYNNIYIRHGDGIRGWPERAPFDAIVVAAWSPGIPGALKDQLAIGGRLVIPTGPSRIQRIVRIRRRGENDFAREDLLAVRFVPLVDDEG